MKKKKVEFIIDDCWLNHGVNLYSICDNEQEHYLECHGFPLGFTQKKDAQRVCDALNKCKGLIATQSTEQIIKQSENGDKIEHHDVV